MNREALFCDGTQDYVIPAEPKANEKITLRFRTAHNDVEEVSLLTGDRSYSMWKICAGDEFDFYEIEWQLGEEPFHYSFEIKSGEQIWFYNRYGVSDHREDYYAYTIVPGFKTPEWAKGAVMYQIFVDRCAPFQFREGQIHFLAVVIQVGDPCVLGKVVKRQLVSEHIPRLPCIGLDFLRFLQEAVEGGAVLHRKAGLVQRRLRGV